MPLSLDWLLPQYVLLASLEAPLSAADADHLHQRLPDFLALVPAERKLHLVVDASALAKLPPLPLLKQLAYFTHPRLDWVLLVSRQSSLRMKLIHWQLGLIKAHFRQVPDLERALSNLQALDASLPDESAAL